MPVEKYYLTIRIFFFKLNIITRISSLSEDRRYLYQDIVLLQDLMALSKYILNY